MIADADELLASEPGALPHTVEVLETAGRWWGEPIERDDELARPAYPFHVVFHETPDHEGRLCSRLMRAGATLGATWREQSEAGHT